MKKLVVIAAFCGAVLGVFFYSTLEQRALALRNSAGTYSLPAGNPVVTGTTIQSSWANNTLSDIATTLTASLDRNGNGGMLSPLALINGTVSAPGLTWTSEVVSGLFRNAANDLEFSVNQIATEKWLTTGVVDPRGLTVTQAQSNVAGITTTGNGTGVGIVATGGATNAAGVQGTGTGTGVGGTFANGTVATGATRQDAIALSNGDLSLGAVANATSTTAVTNRLTPSNIPKTWALLTTDGLGNCTVQDGFNITSCAVAPSGVISVTFPNNFANANYAIFGTASQNGPKAFYVASAVVGSMTFQVCNALDTCPTPGSRILCNAVACTISYLVIGKQ